MPMNLSVAWKLLSSLSSLTKQSYFAAKLVRSNAITSDELYALFRLSSNLEEPFRSRTRTLLKSALQFRRLSVPKRNVPLRIPFLSHPLVQKQLNNFLKSFVTTHASYGIPFHLPTCKPCEGLH